jgi:hypothetical protein
MKRIWLVPLLPLVAALVAVLVTPASRADFFTSGNRWVENPDSGGNLALRVNVGGVKTDALTAQGAAGNVAMATGKTFQADAFTNVAGTGSPTFTFGLSSSAPVFWSDGTALLPAAAFTNATTTGFYKAGTNSLGIATNATSAATIDASQKWTFPGVIDPVGGFGTTTDGAASATNSGLVTTGTQTIAGNKSFTGALTENGGGLQFGGNNLIRQMQMGFCSLTTDGGNGFCYGVFTSNVANSSKVSCVGTIQGDSYGGAAISCALVDTQDVRFRVSGKTSGVVNTLVIEWL